jgi:galactose mutarotase-like enzyme
LLDERKRFQALAINGVTEAMPVVIGYHPIFELPDGNRNDWSVSADAKTHWIEIPQRLPTGETQPIENFFGADRTAIQLGKYALIDDVFTDLVRDANGRATIAPPQQQQGHAHEGAEKGPASPGNRRATAHSRRRGATGNRWPSNTR